VRFLQQAAAGHPLGGHGIQVRAADREDLLAQQHLVAGPQRTFGGVHYRQVDAVSGKVGLLHLDNGIDRDLRTEGREIREPAG
jgi:hypothetical protein